MTREQREELKHLMRKGSIAFDEPMSRHSSAEIGGQAEAFIKVEDVEELKSIMSWTRERTIDYRFWGEGCNMLVRDGGIRGLIIKLGEAFSSINTERISGDEMFVVVGAATRAHDLATWSAEHGASGAEILAGFRGTIGGKVMTNAAFEGRAVGELVDEITVIDRECREMTIKKSALRFEERNLKLPRTAVIIRALFRLKKSEPNIVASNIDAILKSKSERVPAGSKSLGRIFKNSGKTDAAILIDEAGLKGVRVGGARVSAQNANYIVNESAATARDVTVLIGLVRERVKEQSGIILETEIEVIGKDK